jgi:hypothetical protein
MGKLCRLGHGYERISNAAALQAWNVQKRTRSLVVEVKIHTSQAPRWISSSLDFFFSGSIIGAMGIPNGPLADRLHQLL